jgi:cellulose synthase/poly-beta-1,6-N-acetylglucosamine synthase-like glycosyltransferase
VTTALFLAAASAVWLGYVYLGYPALLWGMSKIRRCDPVTSNSFFPFVSVLIAARNEEKDIGWKVRETLAWDYPVNRLEVLVASDASDDSTDDVLQEVRDSRFVFVRIRERGGKNAALNRLARIAKGDLLFFTDANSHILPKALRLMVPYFADVRVGCVTGVETSSSGLDTRAVAAGSRAFLDYERIAKSIESRLGSVLTCDGAIFCIRRQLYAELEPELANDLELPLTIRHAGYWILCEPEARSFEKATHSAREEFARRRRISAQGILAMWRLRKCLSGARGIQFASRKLLRWLTLIPFATVFISTISLRASGLFATWLALYTVFFVLAAAGWIASMLGKNGSRFISFPFFFLLANSAAAWGIVEACLGRRFRIWEAASLSRGRPDATV